MNIKVKFIGVALFLMQLIGCNSNLPISNVSTLSDNIVAHEISVANIFSKEKSTIKLMGFKTVTAKTDTEKDFFVKLANHAKSLIHSNEDHTCERHLFFAEDGSFYRVYFPLHTAIIEYHGEYFNAGENRVINNPEITDLSKIKIIGRKKSKTVRGTGSNIILADKILLKNELQLYSQQEGSIKGYSHLQNNILVFDFGDVFPEQNSLRSFNGDTPPSCYENHNEKNCTDAFNIYQGRCARVHDTCMDYNGWYTDIVPVLGC